MKFNGIMALGLILLIIGGSIGFSEVIVGPDMPPGSGGVPEGSSDSSPPEYDASLMVPQPTANYHSLEYAYFVTRDLQSDIASVKLTIAHWVDGSPTQMVYDLQNINTATTGWETWKLVFPTALAAGEYTFYFTAISGGGSWINTATSTFHILTPEQYLPTVPQTGSLEISFTVNGVAVQSPCLFTVTFPNYTKTDLYGSGFILKNIPTGTYAVKGTYDNEIQTTTAQVTAGQKATCSLAFTSTSSGSTVPDLPKEPTATNISASAYLPFGGMLMIGGLAVFVVGMRKKVKAKR